MTLFEASKGIDDFLINHLSSKDILFRPFDHVFLFGSALYDDLNCNDVDLLLIYHSNLSEIIDLLRDISSELQLELGTPVDLTILSEREEQEISFLEHLQAPYLRIK